MGCSDTGTGTGYWMEAQILVPDVTVPVRYCTALPIPIPILWDCSTLPDTGMSASGTGTNEKRIPGTGISVSGTGTCTNEKTIPGTGTGISVSGTGTGTNVKTIPGTG